jgi:hypothetical protein
MLGGKDHQDDDEVFVDGGRVVLRWVLLSVLFMSSPIVGQVNQPSRGRNKETKSDTTRLE